MLRGPYVRGTTPPIYGPYYWGSEEPAVMAATLTVNEDSTEAVLSITGDALKEGHTVSATPAQIDGIDLPAVDGVQVTEGMSPAELATGIASTYDGQTSDDSTVSMSATASGADVTFAVTSGTAFTKAPTLSSTPPSVQLAITSPTDGEAVTDAAYSISGEGVEPGADVELWVQGNENGAVETVTADSEGNFTFDGGSHAYGETTWIVKSGDKESAPVTVTAPEEAAEDTAAYDGMTTHAELDKYLADNGIDQPDGWGGKTIAAKKEWIAGYLNDN